MSKFTGLATGSMVVSQHTHVHACIHTYTYLFIPLISYVCVYIYICIGRHTRVYHPRRSCAHSCESAGGDFDVLHVLEAIEDSRTVSAAAGISPSNNLKDEMYPKKGFRFKKYDRDSEYKSISGPNNHLVPKEPDHSPVGQQRLHLRPSSAARPLKSAAPWKNPRPILRHPK